MFTSKQTSIGGLLCAAVLLLVSGCRVSTETSAVVAADAGERPDVDETCMGATCSMLEDDDASCSDGVDNDGNGFIDCDDFSCSRNVSVRVCWSEAENTQARCSDGLDNDDDGFTDCADDDCLNLCQAASCDAVTQSGCADGLRCSASGLAAPRCVPNITSQACVIDESTCGFGNNCEAEACDLNADTNPTGFVCDAGSCKIYCDANRGCVEDEFCHLSTTDPFLGGLCSRPCSLFDDSGCADTEGCVLTQATLDASWQSKCVRAPGQTQQQDGEACYRLQYQSFKSCDTGLLCVGDDVDERFCRPVCDASTPCADPALGCYPIDVDDVESTTRACQPKCQEDSCQEENRSVCNAESGEALCECDPEFVDVDGQCLPADACEPNPCTASNRGSCSVNNYMAVCECDTGFVEDDEGICQDATPCTPNPCSFNATGHTLCNASGLDYSCQCPAGALEVDGECRVECLGGYHLDGDFLEPNECSSMATGLVRTPAGSSVATHNLSIGPLADDVDYYRVPTLSGHTYWVLQNGDASYCGLDDENIHNNVSSQWNFATQGAGTSDLSFSCRNAEATTGYGLALLDFRTGTDYSNSMFSPTILPMEQRWAANTLANNLGDNDYFEFTADAPFNIRHTGQTMRVRATLYDANTGQGLGSVTSICGQSFTPSSCIDIEGSGLVRIRIAASYSPEFAVDTQSLTAYHFGW